MNRQMLILILFLLLIGGGAFIWIQQVGTADATYQTLHDQFESDVVRIRKLTEIRFNTGFLQDPLFRSLSPLIATTTSNSVTGRQNPFLPF